MDTPLELLVRCSQTILRMNIKKVNNPNRFIFLDCFRGFAVLLMIIFHLGYDLSHFHFVKINFFRDPFWYYFPRVIVLLFMTSVGISLNLSHFNGINWKSFKLRSGKLFLASLFISISTYFMFPRQWIYFGTLHCILISSFLALPLFLLSIKRRKWFSLLITIVIFILYFFDVKVPWIKLSQTSLDYIPPFPWFGFVTLGILLQSIGFHRIRLKNFKLVLLLKWLGKHSFIIYIIHQPILFSLTFLVHYLLNFSLH